MPQFNWTASETVHPADWILPRIEVS